MGLCAHGEQGRRPGLFGGSSALGSSKAGRKRPAGIPLKFVTCEETDSERPREIVSADKPLGGGLDDHIYNRLLKERIIFLGSDVRDDNANAICAQMLLPAAGGPGRGHLAVHQLPGGSVTAGMAIFDTMQWVPCDVATVAMGMAARMGQFSSRQARPASATPPRTPGDDAPAVRRHRRHRPDIKIQAEQMLHIKKQMARLIAEHTGQSIEQIDRTRTETGGSPPRRPRPTARRPRHHPGPAGRLRRRDGRRSEHHVGPLVGLPGSPLARPTAPEPAPPDCLPPPAATSCPSSRERTSCGMKRLDPYTA